MINGGPAQLRHGIVADFDDPAGYGTIIEAAPDGATTGESPVEWFFHCSAIADGSRSIEPGTRITCHLVAGHMGRIEATDIRPA